LVPELSRRIGGHRPSHSPTDQGRAARFGQRHG